jgi:hypothetical protein
MKARLASMGHGLSAVETNYMAQNYQNVNLVFTNETHWDEMLLEFYKYK